ncbi:MAG: 3-phosphoshikimate 1-carboxyvinyltransferase [Myxococcota bacterium]|nr:3-phosphoshikimate 1-carboxyvinyltransferase [Myxococcota bacterium]
MSIRVVRSSGALRGRIRVPGDKSISHRALLLNALAHGRARVRGLLDSADVRSTATCLQAMGVDFRRDGEGVIVTGRSGRLAEPDRVLDCGNAGTTIRLLCGALAGQSGHFILTGDESLRGRPMARVIEPLRHLGARVDGAADGARAPLAIRGVPHLRGGRVAVPVASAQVKSALLLAGLAAESPVDIAVGACRDHTERMFRSMGVPVEDTAVGVRMVGGRGLEAVDVDVPGDISSAAFWLVAASIVPGSALTLEGVGVNPSRTGVLDVLKRMGADIELCDARTVCGEPVADIHVRSAPLRGTTIAGAEIPRLIDEIPVLAVAAALADGETIVQDASELRVKESDRIETTLAMLHALGSEGEARPDGLVLPGAASLRGGCVQSAGDHRIAMAGAVAALAAAGETRIDGADAVEVSYPGFFSTLEASSVTR